MREGLRGLNKEEVKLATEISIEIGIAEAPTLTFYRACHILGHMCVPPPTLRRVLHNITI